MLLGQVGGQLFYCSCVQTIENNLIWFGILQWKHITGQSNDLVQNIWQALELEVLLTAEMFFFANNKKGQSSFMQTFTLFFIMLSIAAASRS